MDKELRCVMVDDAELRAETVDGKVRLTGYAAVFNKRSQNLGGFVEIIKPGAFDEVLRMNPDVIATYNHTQLLGRTSSGTLQIEANARGLKYLLDLPNTRQDIAELTLRGDLRGSSFKFIVADGGESWDFSKDVAVRTITRIGGLFDVGPVDNPAYLDTSVAVRSMDAMKPQTIGTSCDWLSIRLKAIDR